MKDAWANIWTIAKRELVGYFDSPVAYVFIVIYLLLAGFFTFTFGAFFDRNPLDEQARVPRRVSPELAVPFVQEILHPEAARRHQAAELVEEEAVG